MTSLFISYIIQQRQKTHKTKKACAKIEISMGFWRKKVVREDEDIMSDDEVAVPSLAKDRQQSTRLHVLI